MSAWKNYHPCVSEYCTRAHAQSRTTMGACRCLLTLSTMTLQISQSTPLAYVSRLVPLYRTTHTRKHMYTRTREEWTQMFGGSLYKEENVLNTTSNVPDIPQTSTLKNILYNSISTLLLFSDHRAEYNAVHCDQG